MPKCPQCGFVIKTKKARIIKDRHLEFVLLTAEEFEKIKKKWPRTYQEKIKALNMYGHTHAKKFKEYDSHYHVLLVWNKDAPAEYEQKKTIEKPPPPKISTPKIRLLNRQCAALAKCFTTPSTPKEREDAKKEIERLGEQVNELVEKEKGKVGR